LKAIDHPISKTAQILVEACSFAGTGNVLKIQAMLHHCDDHITASKKDAKEEKKDSKEESKPDATFPSFRCDRYCPYRDGRRYWGRDVPPPI
jgi:26S proteasome regulatory subunit N1